jgi:hypothetical protein
MAAPSPFTRIRELSEEKWRTVWIRKEIWGFQIQAGTRWNSGLADSEIAEFESKVKANFPPQFRSYLRELNGTDQPAIDIRGNSGEAHRFGPAFYAYPRDIERVLQSVEFAARDRAQLRATLAEEGFDLRENARLIPIYGHRFVVCLPEGETCAVVSILNAFDAIVYGSSVSDYLYRELGLDESSSG